MILVTQTSQCDILEVFNFQKVLIIHPLRGMRLKKDASDWAKSPIATESKVPGVQLVFFSIRNYFCGPRPISLKTFELFLGSMQMSNVPLLSKRLIATIAILDQSDIQSNLLLLFNPDNKKHLFIYIKHRTA